MPSPERLSSDPTTNADSLPAGLGPPEKWAGPRAVNAAGDSAGPPLLPADRMAHAPAIVQGIITHFVEPDLRDRLQEPPENLRLVEDLGLDSLTMMEIMMRVEDMLQITISDEELRHFRTLGEVRNFVDRAARAGSAPLAPA